MARRQRNRSMHLGWSIAIFGLQVAIALALPIAFCALAPASALTWAGVIAIGLLGFALLHGGLTWLVPVLGALALVSLSPQLPVDRTSYLVACAVLSFLVGAWIVAADATRMRRLAQFAGSATTREEQGSSAQAASGITAQVVDGSVVLTWQAPASTGGFPITGYQVQVSTDGGLTWATTRTVPASERSAVINDLTGGREVSFRIAAINAAGVGPASRPTSAVIPLGPPGAPNGLHAEPGDGQVRLTWTAPVNDGGYPVVDYLVRMSADGGSTWVVVPRLPSTECIAVATGLVNGRSYEFTVAAVNERGTGASSERLPNVKPAGMPGSVVIEGCEQGDQCVLVRWSAPSTDGGLPLLGYVVETSHDGGQSWVLADRPDPLSRQARISGLVNGIPYVVRVSALNAAGRGPVSGMTPPVVPLGPPGQVGTVQADLPRQAFVRRGDVVPRQRRRAPVGRVLVSATLVIAGAALTGYAVMRTMEGDEAFRLGQSGIQVSDAGITLTDEEEAGSPVVGVEPSDLPEASDSLAAPQSPAGDASAGAGSSGTVPSESVPSETVPVPAMDADPQVPLGQVVGTLAFFRAGQPIITTDGYLVRQGVGKPVLAMGPGHYPTTPLPGTEGNAAIAGHRTGWGSPFLHLDELQPGDEITFTDPEGLVSRYLVDSTVIVKPDETWVLDWDPLQAGMPTLTLTTCDPPHVNDRRLVVFARTAI